MALPTLNATFASAADLPRKYMLARWLVEELGEAGGNSNVLISGAGSTLCNGLYIYDGILNGKPIYRKDLNTIIFWETDSWFINDGEEPYQAVENVDYPWLVTSWNITNGLPPAPIVAEVQIQSSSIANYYDLPERYLWAKIAVAAGATLPEANYISLPKQYVWKAIYDAVSGSSLGTIDWSEKQALGHIAAAYRGDTANPANLATYIDWPWRYQVASIIAHLLTPPDPETFNAVIVAGAGSVILNDTYVFDGNVNGRPSYRGIIITSSVISWDGSRWFINENGDDYYESTSDVAEPWLATGWGAIGGWGQEPVPTVTPTNV